MGIRDSSFTDPAALRAKYINPRNSLNALDEANADFGNAQVETQSETVFSGGGGFSDSGGGGGTTAEPFSRSQTKDPDFISGFERNPA